MNPKHDAKAMASRSPLESTTVKECGCELDLRRRQLFNLRTSAVSFLGLSDND